MKGIYIRFIIAAVLTVLVFIMDAVNYGNDVIQTVFAACALLLSVEALIMCWYIDYQKRNKNGGQNRMKKYELTEETKVFCGHTLHRIKYLVDIEQYDIHKGDLGGWLESEDNLSQEGLCAVYGNAMVFGDALVCDNARISGDAVVFGDAWLAGDAWVFGDAKVYDYAEVLGDAIVFGNAKVCDYARVRGSAWVYGKTRVVGGCIITGRFCFDEEEELSIDNEDIKIYRSLKEYERR